MAEPNMQDLMAKAKEMQHQMQKAQKDIMAITVIGKSKDGRVKIKLNGAHRAQSAEVSPTLMGEEEEELEKRIIEAINHASDQIEETTKQKMLEIAQDMKLPQNESKQ